ncbi:MAG: acetate--CoA ligase family protein [Pseudomonadota bacterium]|nr:acetate--CoA ligase family protein [Pseudomonadota bacterium]
MFRDVEPLLKPKSMAIVGASETGGEGWSRVLYQNLKDAGMPVKTYLINPQRDKLWGERVYPNFGALPQSVEHAAILVPAQFVNTVMRDGIANGLRAATIFSAGFGEGRKKIGAERGEELSGLISDAKLSVCGPNCMGTFSLPQKILQYPTSRLRNLKLGKVGGVFHSGGTLGYWFARAAQRGLGFSYAVSCGNEFGLDCADYINFLADDPDTEIIVGMLESIRRPQAFIAAAEKAFRAEKPLILVKLGRSEMGKEQAKTHTGAVAVDDDVFMAACRRFGITRASNLDDMVEMCLAFQQKRYPTGKRLAVVTSSGGAVGLSIDAAEEEGAVLAALSQDTIKKMEEIIPEDVDVHNPMDAGTRLAGNVERFINLCGLFAADPGVDIVALQGRLPLPTDPEETHQHYIKLKNETGKPVLGLVRMSENADDKYRSFQEAAQIPFLFGIPQTVRAAKALINYGEARRRGIPELFSPIPDSKLCNENLSDSLSMAGIRTPSHAIARSPEQAADFAAGIGFPVAIKITSDTISHKTEAGGVRLGLKDREAVKGQAEDLIESIGQENISGFLVQEMVAGTEMLVGLRDDPDFGPLLVIGLGGVFVEILKDVSLRLIPVDEPEVRAMLSELRGSKILDGYRGQPAPDVDALVENVMALCGFFLDHREVLSEMEINPLMVLERGKGVRAIDIRPVWKNNLT